jgi:hypothetical protein
MSPPYEGAKVTINDLKTSKYWVINKTLMNGEAYIVKGEAPLNVSERRDKHSLYYSYYVKNLRRYSTDKNLQNLHR